MKTRQWQLPVCDDALVASLPSELKIR